MKKTSLQILPTVSVILPMRNASSTVEKALNSVILQDYPIQEIILVDNVSTDDSVRIAEKHAKKHTKIPIRIIRNKTDIMVAGSFNKGIKAAKTEYVALMHSDCCYASKNELRKLIMPMTQDPSIVATYGLTQNPLSVWNQYSFWEKVLLSREAGKIIPGLVGKTDCFRREKLLSIGGYDDSRYKNYGGEDADLHFRLKRIGKIIPTKARALHLHYLYKDFSLLNLIRKKKATARTYGRVLKVQGFTIGLVGILSHLAKPILAIGAFIPGINILFIPALIIFPFWYYQRVFTTSSTLSDPRILILPFVGIFLIYYETFWIVYAFLQPIPRR